MHSFSKNLNKRLSDLKKQDFWIITQKKLETLLAGLPDTLAFWDLGFSGGPDSLFLALSLHEYLKKHPELPAELRLLHVSHGMRTQESQKEEDGLVSQWAEFLGCKLLVRTFVAGELLESFPGEGLEDSARRARHDFFRTINQSGESRLFLGHHMQDQSETVLMRLLQGHSPFGLASMDTEGSWIMRPLLGVSGMDIRRHLDDYQIPYFQDPSNSSTSFLRNQLRKSLGELRNLFPQMDRALWEFSREEKRSLESSWSHVQNNLPWILSDQNIYSFPFQDFKELNPKERILVLQKLRLEFLRKTGSGPGGRRRIPYNFFRPLLVPELGENRTLKIQGHGWLLQRQGDRVYWGPVKGAECCHEHLFLVLEKGILREWQGLGYAILPGSSFLLEDRFLENLYSFSSPGERFLLSTGSIVSKMTRGQKDLPLGIAKSAHPHYFSLYDMDTQGEVRLEILENLETLSEECLADTNRNVLVFSRITEHKEVQ